MALTLSTAQTVADNWVEVATKTKTLLDGLTITTLNEVIIRNFGTDKWLIVVVYQ